MRYDHYKVVRRQRVKCMIFRSKSRDIMPYKSDEFRAVKITTFKSQIFSYTYVLALIL